MVFRLTVRHWRHPGDWLSQAKNLTRESCYRFYTALAAHLQPTSGLSNDKTLETLSGESWHRFPYLPFWTASALAFREGKGVKQGHHWSLVTTAESFFRCILFINYTEGSKNEETTSQRHPLRHMGGFLLQGATPESGLC